MKMKTSINFGANCGTSTKATMSTTEKHLGTFAGEEAGTRIQLVQVAGPNETPTVEFRYQRHGESLGWVTHRRMRMAAGQVGQLQSALNMMDPDGRDADIADEPSDLRGMLEVVEGGEAKKSSG